MLCCADLADGAIDALFAPYRLRTERLPHASCIPGTYWGEPEAGLVGDTLYFRDDTPVHSLLHEGAHYVCLPPARRAGLHTDAGGDDQEECAVCYLQVLLADALPGVARERLFADMDDWGYSFRLGSAAAWFREDAADALDWLVRAGLVGADGRPRPVLRDGAG